MCEAIEEDVGVVYASNHRETMLVLKIPQGSDTFMPFNPKNTSYQDIGYLIDGSCVRWIQGSWIREALHQ